MLGSNMKDNIVMVRRFNDMIMMIKLVVNTEAVNIASAYVLCCIVIWDKWTIRNFEIV